MSNLVYDLTFAPILRSLHALDAFVSKAEAHLEAHPDIEPSTLVNARLYPDMGPFVFQIRVATDIAKAGAARLSGNTPPSWADDEETFEEIHQRINKAIDYINEFEAADFEGAEARDIELKLRGNAVHFTGTGYIANFVMPNVYFHITTAYDILRHNGVVLGKMDYIGKL